MLNPHRHSRENYSFIYKNFYFTLLNLLAKKTNPYKLPRSCDLEQPKKKKRKRSFYISRQLTVRSFFIIFQKFNDVLKIKDKKTKFSKQNTFVEQSKLKNMKSLLTK